MENGVEIFRAVFLRLDESEKRVFLQLQRLKSPGCAAFRAAPVD
jgi:hypothetical protein